jgi:MOSC domain-containing protein YiiM
VSVATILQINISRGGLPKRSIPQAEVTTLGITGDVQAHPEFHGGPDKALLIITSEGIEELIAQGFSLFYGAMGENFTTRGIDRREMRTGQRYRTGEIVFELTDMRLPCSQLSPYGPGIQRAVYDEQIAAGDHSSPRWALSGFYASVLVPGTVRPGDPIQFLEALA